MVEGNPEDTHRRSFFSSWWFWLLLISIIVLVLALVIWLVQKKTPWYFWTLLIGGGVLLIISIILAIVYFQRPSQTEQSEKISKRTLKTHAEQSALISQSRPGVQRMTPTYSIRIGGETLPRSPPIHELSPGTLQTPIRK